MNIIRQLRERLSLTQGQLARYARTSQPTVAQYESGNKSPTLHTLRRIFRACGLELFISWAPAMTRADRRSLLYHQRIAEKLRGDPEAIIARAQSAVQKMRRQHPHAQDLLDLWQQWLKLPLHLLIDSIVDPQLLARDMRQVSPFAGVLSSAERTAVLRELRSEERSS